MATGKLKKVPQMQHITQRKDLLEINPDLVDSESGGSKVIMCPISGKRATGPGRFYAMIPCGHVISETALKEIQGKGNKSVDNCPKCGKELGKKKQKMIWLNPPEDKEKEFFQKLMHALEERKKKKELKRMKKKRKREEVKLDLQPNLADEKAVVLSAVSVKESPTKKAKLKMDKSKAFNSIFLSEKEYKSLKPAYISTKPDSLNARL